MPGKWYEKPMRIAALQCNFEKGRTLEVIDKWVESGFNTEQLFHPMAESYTAVYDPAVHGALLREYLAAAKRKGLRIILYQNVHIIQPSEEAKREIWAQRTTSGEYPKLYDTYYGCCVNSAWRDYFFGVIDQVGALDIDGIFLDGPVFYGKGCFCPSCRQRYREWYGGDLTETAERWDFYRRSLDVFLRESYRRFKARKPEALFYMNFGLMHPTASYYALPDALDYNDILGTEGGFMFYGPPQNAYLWRVSVASKTLEAVAPRRPRVVFMAADQKSWSWYPHTPVETQLCIASTVANGASIWYGLHGSTELLATPGGRAATSLLRRLAANECYFEGTASASRVAVLFSYDTERSYRTAAEASDLYGVGGEKSQFLGNATDAFNGVCDALARSSVPFDVVTDLDLSAGTLGRYECLILPTSACLRSSTLDAVRSFVRAGGNLVASFDTSLLDENGKPRADFGLADVLGVRSTGRFTAYQDFNYLSVCESHPLFDEVVVPRWPAPGVGVDVVALDGATVLARFHGAQPGRYTDPTPPEKPAIVWHRYGKGTSLYLAGTFAEMCHTFAPPEYRRLLRNAARLFSRAPVVLEGTLGNVELVARTQPGRLLVHLINYAGLPPRPFDAVAPQSGLRLRFPGGSGIRKVRAVFAGVDLALEQDGSDLVAKLPVLDVYELFTAER
jgi:hypothetical protein